MQGDGNLVSYTADGSPQWASGSRNTVGNPGARLVIQDDGNLVIYVNNNSIWTSNTVQPPIKDTLQPNEALESASNGTITSQNALFRLVQQSGTVIMQTVCKLLHAYMAPRCVLLAVMPCTEHACLPSLSSLIMLPPETQSDLPV